jgi:hypothetical protein
MKFSSPVSVTWQYFSQVNLSGNIEASENNKEILHHSEYDREIFHLSKHDREIS